MTDEKTTKNPLEDRIPTELRDSARKIWFAGLGALSAAEEEGSKLFRSLVEKGEQYEAKGRDAVSDARHDIDETVEKVRGRAESTWDRFEDQIDERLSGTLRRFGVPTREEIATLTQRVEELTRLVESLKDKAPAAKAKAPVKKAPAKKATTRRSTAKAATA
ncbi:MAG: phasin family protein [Acidobacteriota bacterium]